jgi:hypothetical protein
MLAKVHTYTLIEKNHNIFWRVGQIENHISKRCLGNSFPATYACGTCH